MKKLLLCTTALFGLVAGSAVASEDVAVTFHGQSKFEAGTKKQDTDHKAYLPNSPNQKSSAFYTSQRASLKAEGKSDTLTYGAVLRLQMVADQSNGMGDTHNDRSHIYLDTDMGSVHLGSNFSASKLMQIDAGVIASATGGVDGDWTNFAGGNVSKSKYDLSDRAANMFESIAVTGVDTLANRMDSGESSRKITYMSPRISGVQLGLSFAPDFNNSGTGTVNESMYFGLPVKVKNLWSVGLGYANTINDVQVALSAVADKGQASRQDDGEKFRDLKTYSIGGSVATNGFTVALSYASDGQSLTLKSEDRFKSSWWTAGVAYANGPMSVSLTYLAGEKGSKDDGRKVKSQMVSLGADYEVAPGFQPFAEVTMVQYKPKNDTVTYNNVAYDTTKAKATVFMVGTKLKF